MEYDISTTKRRWIWGSILGIAINLPISVYLATKLDPTIPINKAAVTIGLILFLGWMVLPFFLGWTKKKVQKDGTRRDDE